jgi:hypothetical protein
MNTDELSRSENPYALTLVHELRGPASPAVVRREQPLTQESR